MQKAHKRLFNFNSLYQNKARSQIFIELLKFILIFEI